MSYQIDPFGHSSLTPSLFAKAGFDALVINRIHFDVKVSAAKILEKGRSLFKECMRRTSIRRQNIWNLFGTD